MTTTAAVTPVTPEHAKALVAHLSDLLSVDVDVARSLLAEIVGESPVYQDLVSVTAEAVAEASRTRGVGPSAVKRVAAAALVAGIDPSAPTCNRCGRMALRLVGAATWTRVEGAACPVDQGLYVVPERSVVVSWVDGREFPAGTTHDANRVPLTDRAVLDARKVDARVLAACEETGVSIRDALAALVRQGKTAAQALAVVTAPDGEFVDVTALRVFVARSKGAAGVPAGEAVSPPAGGYNDRRLREALASLYPTASKARAAASDAGLDHTRIDFSGDALTMWFGIIDAAKRQRCLAEVVAVARNDYPKSPALVALDTATVYDALCQMLPVQIDDAARRLGVPTQYMPGAAATQAEKAAALMRLAEQQGKMAQLRALVVGR